MPVALTGAPPGFGPDMECGLALPDVGMLLLPSRLLLEEEELCVADPGCKKDSRALTDPSVSLQQIEHIRPAAQYDHLG